MEKTTMETLIKPGFRGMKRVVDFGKFDFNHTGRKINKMDVDVRIYDEFGNGRVVLSIMGGIWNGRGTDYTICGQCLDEMAKFVHTPMFKKIYGWWKKYHLNTIPPDVLDEIKAFIAEDPAY